MPHTLEWGSISGSINTMLWTALKWAMPVLRRIECYILHSRMVGWLAVRAQHSVPAGHLMDVATGGFWLFIQIIRNLGLPRLL
mmetsp:Transcript_43382/g.101268  ORF Transcript_43382/g.101268 Transcript_43382/m.101268 type:complete len:83 (+) Transcript_43382:290-538(+)